MNILEKMFGTYSAREIKKIQPIVDKIMSLDKEYTKLTSEQLQNKTQELKERLKNETLDDILPEAFATVREVSWRVLGLKPYEVQVIGAIILHQGRIAEMKTGEGKTLVATMPAYLNALTGKGVLVVTANEYLAKRDSEQMGKVHQFLGLSVGFLNNKMPTETRKEQYSKDILYTTNNEVGFDYLRDNMAVIQSKQVQRDFFYVIIDEVDSILIDESRTPLIISGQGEGDLEGYMKANEFVKKLNGVVKDNKENEMSKIEMTLNDIDEDDKYINYDFIVDKKNKTVVLTEKGVKKAEKFYEIDNLMDIENVEINHYISQSLKAYSLFRKDVDYLIKDGEIVIIDEHTGRIMDGRRYSEGVHQAIEVKENVEVKNESKTLATITFQNLFRKFEKLSGMTGTGMTENTEFREIYNIDVVEIPTNKPLIREDKVDKVYLGRDGKIQGIIETVQDCNKRGQPILVGTASVEASEELSTLFTRAGIEHNVLNAKNHEEEAMIIAKAGHYGKVTIATNMAGRGTDIMLGGNVEFKTKEELSKLGYPNELIELSNTHTDTDDENVIEIRNKYKEVEEKVIEEIQPWINKVKEAGGLYVLGTERHSSRRIDNQLRGRAGRQGDPGVSEFMISMEDDLMMTFGVDRFTGLFDKMDLPKDIPIDIKIIANSIETAQKKVEGLHYYARKTLMDYDTVMNIQREIVYEQRNKFLKEDNILNTVLEMTKIYIEDNINSAISNPNKLTLDDQENINQIFNEISELNNFFNYSEDDLYSMKPEDLINELYNEVNNRILEFIDHTYQEYVNENSKNALLFYIDKAWQDHLVAMEDLKDGIGLRAVGQQDPVMAYKNEGYYMFNDMLNNVRHDVLAVILQNHQNVMNLSKEIEEE